MPIFQKWSEVVKGNNAFAGSLVGLITEHAFSQSMLRAKSLSSKYEKMWEGGLHKVITIMI